MKNKIIFILAAFLMGSLCLNIFLDYKWEQASEYETGFQEGFEYSEFLSRLGKVEDDV